jgi:translation initiation factor 1
MSRLFSGTPFERPIVCETCHQAVADCTCTKLPPKHKMSERPGGKHHGTPPSTGYKLTPANSDPPKDQRANIRTEKRKGGKMVTVITGLEHPANDLPALCADLKSKLGAGGSVQGRTIEIQGEKAEGVKKLLTDRSIAARVVG